jgi:hypothetical protein
MRGKSLKLFVERGVVALSSTRPFDVWLAGEPPSLRVVTERVISQLFV